SPTPVVPRPAATILLVDHAEPPWRVLMMQRPRGADFMPGAYVFPGGSEHAEDRGLADPSRAAGIRELFEEMGMLLARRPAGRWCTSRGGSWSRSRTRRARRAGSPGSAGGAARPRR